MFNTPQLQPATHAQADRLRILRAALRRRYGFGRYRITTHGVYAYSPMPNASHTTGWWLLGDIAHAERQLDIV
jgi:hypothetical protein